MHRRLDGDGAVEQRLDADGGRDLALDLQKRGPDAARDRDGVGPGWRWISSTMDRAPLYQLAVLLFWTSSVTRPAPQVDGPPFRLGHDQVVECVALPSWPVAWTVSAVRGPTARRSAGSRSGCDGGTTSSSARLREASCEGRAGCGRYFCAPNTSTWATRRHREPLRDGGLAELVERREREDVRREGASGSARRRGWSSGTRAA